MESLDSWPEYRRLVLSELEKLTAAVGHLTKEVENLRTDMATMKAKTGLLAALTSAGTSLAVGVLWWLSK